MPETDKWLIDYAENHVDIGFGGIYWVAVLTLVIGATGLLWSLPIPQEFAQISPVLNWGRTFLMAAVRAGAGRETAHAAIKEHALATAHDLRDDAITSNDLLDRLASDERIPLSRPDLQRIFEKGGSSTGAAGEQVDRFIQSVGIFTSQHPGAAAYKPGEIL